MRRESEKGAATRLRIMRAAADLFHKQGVGATSPDEILEASRAGKGQFYHYFGSKERLVHEVLQSYIEGVETGTGPVNYEVGSWEDLERWFASHIELQKKFRMMRGCPFGTVGNGVTVKDELIRQDLSHLFEIVKNRLRAFFIRERAQGRLTADADEDRLADFCIATIQGGMLMGKVKRSPLPVEAAVGEALAHLRRYVAPSAASPTVANKSATRPRSRSRRTSKPDIKSDIA
jgi:TetR/AcrR family transcriptional regulator, transcriptional repressor for nem operon